MAKKKKAEAGARQADWLADRLRRFSDVPADEAEDVASSLPDETFAAIVASAENGDYGRVRELLAEHPAPAETKDADAE